MEIQLRNSEQVPQEWKLYGSGNAIAIRQAQSAITLRVRNEEDIKQALRYSMLLVGLRGSNLPTEEEKFVLTNFVKSNFGNNTCEEIKLAFEMAVAGKLNIDCNCYENFSCEYFGRIMSAYLEYARQEIKNLPKPIEPFKEKPSDQELKKQAIDTANEYANQIRFCEKNCQRLKLSRIGRGFEPPPASTAIDSRLVVRRISVGQAGRIGITSCLYGSLGGV